MLEAQVSGDSRGGQRRLPSDKLSSGCGWVKIEGKGTFKNPVLDSAGACVLFRNRLIIVMRVGYWGISCQAE
jgi:hypothetical protein